ncbi:Histone acetyltransferase [Toensbergia leucococca]|nr:Histone acetyltransferase [Toensbergia leucococca]
MAPRDASQDDTTTPDPVEKGFATLNTLRVGVKVFVEKDGEKRKAEILSIQSKKGQPTYYVHYEEFNKRLDGEILLSLSILPPSTNHRPAEWIPASRLDLTQEVEWPPEIPAKKTQKSIPPAPKSAPLPKTTANQKRRRNSNVVTTSRDVSATPELVSSTGNSQGKALRPSLAGGKENRLRTDSDGDISVVAPEILEGTPKADEEDIDILDVQDAAAAAKASGPVHAGPYSREQEIEKLRTGGSMTQNQTEISRVRNLSRVQMGAHEMEPWYFSPYPITFTGAEMVYICEFCLSYFDSLTPFSRHRAKCTLLHPPGNEIYRDDHVSFFEIDGRRQRRWCRNLCLLSKLFLDHKTLYYDVDPFLFYCMATRDAHGCHLVGYFSKEKESAEGYNVACILTLPQYQRRGFGMLLIAFSYELSKREGKLGSPEKPLSDLGLLGYRAYWAQTVVEALTEEGRGEVSVEDLAGLSAMTTGDVLHTLQNLNMLRYSKGQHVIVLTNAILEQREKQREKEKIKGKRRIDAERLQWKPPVFTASSRTWNW